MPKSSLSISSGNSKIGEIPNFSLKPVSDCANCDCCRKKCYALKAWRMYPNVRAAWSRNSRAVRKGTRWIRELETFLSENKPPYFRIHVAGDFFSPAYFRQWVELAAKCPGTRFLAFTKSFSEIEEARAVIPSNLSIVFSAFPGLDTPGHMPIAWAGETSDYPANSDRVKKAIVCPGKCDECHLCWHLLETGRDVRFHMH
jgi:ferredoxin